SDALGSFDIGHLTLDARFSTFTGRVELDTTGDAEKRVFLWHCDFQDDLVIEAGAPRGKGEDGGSHVGGDFLAWVPGRFVAFDTEFNGFTGLASGAANDELFLINARFNTTNGGYYEPLPFGGLQHLEGLQIRTGDGSDHLCIVNRSNFVQVVDVDMGNQGD